MAETVRGNSDRRLLLTSERLFDHPQIKQRIRPSLIEENRVAATMLDLGLDRQMLARVPGLTFCPTLYLEPTKPLQDRAADLEINAAYARWHPSTAQAGPLAALIFHRTQQTHFSSTAARSGMPFKIGDNVELASQPLPFGVAARAPYVRAVASGSPDVLLDGGDLYRWRRITC